MSNCPSKAVPYSIFILSWLYNKGTSKGLSLVVLTHVSSVLGGAAELQPEDPCRTYGGTGGSIWWRQEYSGTATWEVSLSLYSWEKITTNAWLEWHHRHLIPTHSTFLQLHIIVLVDMQVLWCEERVYHHWWGGPEDHRPSLVEGPCGGLHQPGASAVCHHHHGEHTLWFPSSLRWRGKLEEIRITREDFRKEECE